MKRALDLPPGPELDARVAEEVMEWRWNIHNNQCWVFKINGPGWELWQPSSPEGIAAAWEVVEKLKEEGDVFIEWWQDNEWTVSNKPVGVRDCGLVVTAPTAPHAICLAALKAKQASSTLADRIADGD